MNWTQLVVDYMLDIRTKDTPLPYGNLVTKILNKTCFNPNEIIDFKEKTTKLEKPSYPQCTISLGIEKH